MLSPSCPWKRGMGAMARWVHVGGGLLAISKPLPRAVDRCLGHLHGGASCLGGLHSLLIAPGDLVGT